MVPEERNLVARIKKLKGLILGGQGKLRRPMSAELESHSIEFVSLSRENLDITNEKDIAHVMRKESPDVIFNAAAWTNVDLAELKEDQAFLVNAIGPRLLAEASAQIGAKFLHISTDYVFSGDSDTPWLEMSEVSPVSAYGRTKAVGERAVLDTHPKGSFLVRTAWLYGPWGKNFVKTMLKFAQEGERKITVVTDQVGQPTSSSDLARQIFLMIARDVRPGIYHGTNSGEASWYELAQEIFRLAGADSDRIVGMNSERYAGPAVRPNYSVLGHSNWMKQGMKPMRPWQGALIDAFPGILNQVAKEA